jgi:hypothetical protein
VLSRSNNVESRMVQRSLNVAVHFLTLPKTTLDWQESARNRKAKATKTQTMLMFCTLSAFQSAAAGWKVVYSCRLVHRSISRPGELLTHYVLWTCYRTFSEDESLRTGKLKIGNIGYTLQRCCRLKNDVALLGLKTVVNVSLCSTIMAHTARWSEIRNTVVFPS